MRTVPFLVSLGLASAGVIHQDSRSGVHRPHGPKPDTIFRRESEPEAEPLGITPIDLPKTASQIPRGIDIKIDMNPNDKARRAYETKVEPEFKPPPPLPAIYRRKPEPEPEPGSDGNGHGRTLHRRQNILGGFDQNQAANSFMSDRGLSSWNDFSAPVNGFDACIVFRALEYLAFSLIEPTGDILSESATRVFLPAGEQNGPLVLDLRGIMIWTAILDRFETQLEATNVWSINTQLEVAECYLTYSQQAGNFLRALNDRARVLGDSDPAKCLTYDKIEALYISYDTVATLIYGRNSGIPANIQQLIPNAFPDPIPATFQTPYAAPASRSLIADYLSIHDDPLPSGDNLFEQAQEAYTCSDFQEDPRPGTAGANNRQQAAADRARAGIAAGKPAADKEAVGGKGDSKKDDKKSKDSKKDDKKSDSKNDPKKDSKEVSKDDSKKTDSKKDSKDSKEPAKDKKKPKKDTRKRKQRKRDALSRLSKRENFMKGSEDGKYYLREDGLNVGLDTDGENIVIDGWLGSKGIDNIPNGKGGFSRFYDTIEIKNMHDALSLMPSWTPGFEGSYYGNRKENAEKYAAIAKMRIREITRDQADGKVPIPEDYKDFSLPDDKVSNPALLTPKDEQGRDLKDPSSQKEDNKDGKKEEKKDDKKEDKKNDKKDNKKDNKKDEKKEDKKKGDDKKGDDKKDKRGD
ncbi:Fc.00g022790.m01.CDS01 [Cosmosporella sp. VM-42]